MFRQHKWFEKHCYGSMNHNFEWLRSIVFLSLASFLIINNIILYANCCPIIYIYMPRVQTYGHIRGIIMVR